MAGLAATLNAPGLIDALAVALAARGSDAAVCRLDGEHDSRLEVGVRAAIPAIPRVCDEVGRTVSAFAIDGVTSVTALDDAYEAAGPSGLLRGDEAVTIVLADAGRGLLVLARDGDGPGLYYARHDDGWLVASEPGALLAAGVPFTPDDAVIHRFVRSGGCDDSEQTFITGIWRVEPDRAVVLAASGEARVEPASSRARASASQTLSAAVRDSRVGILHAPRGSAAARLGMAVIDAALAVSARGRPLPVHTLTTTTGRGRRVAPDGPRLVRTAVGSIRHTPLMVDPATIDIDACLRELGEPVSDLDLLLLWAAVRDLGGVDVVVDTSCGDMSCVARVNDRLAARYGIEVRCPLRGREEEELASISTAQERQLPLDAAAPVTATDILLSRIDSVAAALATPRPWADQAASVGSLRRLHCGQPADDGALLRAYLVERWLRVCGVGDEPDEPANEVVHPDDIDAGGALWARWPVRTESFAAGDRLAPSAAWRVADVVTRMCDARAGSPLAPRPWFVAVSAKVVAVSQHRLSPLWQIKPGVSARMLARVARRPLPWLGEAWTMQVAIDEGGLLPVAAGTMAAGLGRPALAARLLPEQAALLTPARADAMAPANAAVVRSPYQPDDAAEVLLDALRYALPPGLLDTLAGCAVVSADEAGSRVLGFAEGPCVSAVPDAERTLSEILADNPGGQGQQRTPIVLAFLAS